MNFLPKYQYNINIITIINKLNDKAMKWDPKNLPKIRNLHTINILYKNITSRILMESRQKQKLLEKVHKANFKRVEVKGLETVYIM